MKLTHIPTLHIMWSVCLGTSVSHANQQKRMNRSIDMPFGKQCRVGPRNHVLNDNAHWRYIANAVRRFMRGDDTALFQITLTTYAGGGDGDAESWSGENRCLLLRQETTLRRRCGDGYITDRDHCLACGCCFLPDLLPGEHYDTAVSCYAPVTRQCQLTSLIFST